MTALPVPRPLDREAIPPELRDRRQWVGWRLAERGAAKPTKEPLRPFNGARASTTDPFTWGTFEQALDCPGADGVGFVFSQDDPYVGVDLDGCRDPASGEIEVWAQEFISRLNSYTEISPSGTGVHVLVRGSIPGDRRRKGNVEIYSEGRYFTMTGRHLAGTPITIEERTPQIAKFHEAVFGPQDVQGAASPRPLHLSLTDEELISRASDAANGAKFRALWSGNTSEYASASEADLALCSLLAFWTGPDAQRIDRLFRSSALVRPKWDQQHGAETYGQMTIGRALSGSREFAGNPLAHRQSGPVDLGLNEFALTQAGNAEAFAHLHGGRVLFDHRRSRWLIRGEHHWRSDEVGEVVQLSKAVVRARYHSAIEIADEERRRSAIKHAVASESRQHLESLLALARTEPGIADAGDAWDAEPMLLGVQNGVVDLASGALRDGRPDDRISLVVPVPYRADAACPRWEQFLREVFLDDHDLIAFVQRAVGYSLTGDASEHALFLLHGSGRNGKSVFLNTIRAVAGAYAINLPFSAFELMGRSQLTPELALLPGKRLATSSETNDGARLNEARIKAMTGGDPVTANPKYVAPFEFTPVAKYWLAVNHLPVIRDDSEGFWQRVKLIKFMRTFTEEARDKRLEERLRAELPGILAWAVRGAIEWLRGGLDAPESVRVATEEYRVDSDPLEEFLSRECAVGEDLQVFGSELYKAYVQYTEDAGLGPKERLTNAMFGRRMGARFRGEKTKKGKRYLGVGLIDHRRGDGFASGDGFEGRSQKLSLATSSRKKFLQNPSQPVTPAKPVTQALCDDGCGTPVRMPGELCSTCFDDALMRGPR